MGAVKSIFFIIVYTNFKEYALMDSYVITISSEMILHQWKSKPFCWISLHYASTENKEVLRKLHREHEHRDFLLRQKEKLLHSKCMEKVQDLFAF